MRAGGAWTAQLADELAAADAFVLLVGEAGIGNWQVPEYDEALDRWVKSGRTFPLIVVLLEGQTAPGLPFMRQLHWIVTSDPDSEKDVARIFDGASGRGARPPELWRHASPYRGLEAMEEKDSDYFFGRTRETVETLEALGRLPVLIGNSGVGNPRGPTAASATRVGLVGGVDHGPIVAERVWVRVIERTTRMVTLRFFPLSSYIECDFRVSVEPIENRAPSLWSP